MGLTEGQVVTIKPKKWVYDGTDTRDYCYLGWNISNNIKTLQSIRDRNYVDAQNLKRAFRNTNGWNNKIRSSSFLHLHLSFRI
jgi:hypothetical protein